MIKILSKWASTVLVAGIIVWASVGCGRPTTPPTQGRTRGGLADLSQRNVIVILIDTLRADHLPCYGYARDTAPFLCRLAEKSIFFERAISASSYTAPATASIFVGSFPSRHGVITGFVDHGKLSEKNRSFSLNRIPQRHLTLAEFFRDRGFETFSVADNLNVCRDMAFDQGFDHFVTFQYEGAERVNRQVEEWRHELESAGRFFLYLHYMDPHRPYNQQHPWYQPPQDHRQKKFNAYDSEIGYVDHHIAELIESFGWLEDSVVIVLSDHGEEFDEHGGRGHGRTLYREVIHVPFFIHHPELESQVRVRETVSTVSLLPTIAALFGASPRPDWESPALLTTDAIPVGDARTVYSELLRHPVDGRNEVLSVIRGGKHLVRIRFRSRPVEVEEVYDLWTDTAERRDLSLRRPELTAALGGLLTSFGERPLLETPESVEIEVDDETLEQLRRLGYVN